MTNRRNFIKTTAMGLFSLQITSFGWGGSTPPQNLRGSRVIGVDLHGVSLRGANLTGSYFNNVDFRGADLRGAIFKNCFITNSTFDSSQGPIYPHASDGILVPDNGEA